MNNETNYFLSKNDFQCFFYLDFAKCDFADYQISMNLHSNFCLIFAVKNNHGLHDKQRLLDIHRKDNF